MTLSAKGKPMDGTERQRKGIRGQGNPVARGVNLASVGQNCGYAGLGGQHWNGKKNRRKE
jgi:hypothetical protein